MGYLCGLNYLRNKTNNQSDRISLKKQEVINSLARCSWERWGKLWFQTPKKKIKVSHVPLRKHICTLSVGEDKHMIVFPTLSQRTVMGRGNFVDLVQVCSIDSILRLRDGN